MTADQKQKPERETRSPILLKTDWSVLDALALDLSCFAAGGKDVGQPSVTTMLRLIARGELVVTRKVTVSG